MNTPGSVAGGWIAFFAATMIGFYVGREKYGEKKQAMLNKEERDRLTFDQKMAAWEQESKAKNLIKNTSTSDKPDLSKLKPVPVTDNADDGART